MYSQGEMLIFLCLESTLQFVFQRRGLEFTVQEKSGCSVTITHGFAYFGPGGLKGYAVQRHFEHIFEKHT